ncbi:MAG: ketoacyl-ACP synthase III [Anaerolineales bacterium]|nr:ketoacyl-ACP synthase III [Anaerolineales bacterium]
MKYAHIVGWGKYVPRRVMSNDEIAEMVETSNDWIYTRTGIRQRHIAGEKESTATLAFEAAARALAVADISPTQVDLIIVATSTPENSFPSTACQVQSYLGASNAGAFDLSAACSGFVYALDMASQAIATGSIKTAVVIGAEVMSRVLNWEDRGTCILFGDGAGAVVLQGSSVPGGVLATALHSDGSGGNLLQLPNVYKNHKPIMGPEFTLNGADHNTISMHGRQVFRFATQVVPEIIQEVLHKANLTPADLDLIVPHQANSRIIESAAKKLGVDSDLFFVNVQRVGNTSAASIPIALCEAVEQDRLQPNNRVLFVGFGGGLTWAAALISWDARTPEEMHALEKQMHRTRYALARGRSRLRQIGRALGARLSRSPTPDARLRDADKNKKKEDKKR